MATDVDAILQELGPCGRYQALTYLLLSLPMVFAIVSTHSFVFTSGDLDYRCRVPECGDDGSEFEPPWLSQAVPMEERGGAVVPAKCVRYTPVEGNTTCGVFAFGNDTQGCTDWVFRGHEDSIAREWNLTCADNRWKLTLSGTMVFGGALISKPLSGYVSDRWGRRFALLAGLLLTSLTGILRSLSPSYAVYQGLNLAEGVAGGGIYTSAFVMGLELMEPSRRVLGGAIMSTYNPVGELVVGAVSWYLQKWRTILMVIYTPAVLFVCYYWLLPESLRWLVSQGRTAEAEAMVRRAATVNGVRLHGDYFRSMTSLHSVGELSRSKPAVPKRSPMVQVVQSRLLLCRLITCSFCWTSIAFVFAGMTFNATSLGGNKYVNYILTGLIELPSPLLTYVGMNRMGRKVTLCSSLMVSGLCCLLFLAVPPAMSWVRVALYLAGKFHVTISFDVLYIFAVEMFPTEARQSLLAACSVLGGLGGLAAPQVPLLARYMDALPLLLFAAMAVASGLLALLLPETRGVRLPDTVAEAEAIGRGRGGAETQSP